MPTLLGQVPPVEQLKYHYVNWPKWSGGLLGWKLWVCMSGGDAGTFSLAVLDLEG